MHLWNPIENREKRFCTPLFLKRLPGGLERRTRRGKLHDGFHLLAVVPAEDELEPEPEVHLLHRGLGKALRIAEATCGFKLRPAARFPLEASFFVIMFSRLRFHSFNPIPSK